MAAGNNSIVWTTEWVANCWAHHVVEVDMKQLWKKRNLVISNVDSESTCVTLEVDYEWSVFH